MPRKKSSKKIILFIVEGITDQTCLGMALNSLLTSNSIKFAITYGDITTKAGASPATIVKSLGLVVVNFLSGVFEPSDIQEVVHLVDTDGAFIPDAAVQSHGSSIYYDDDFIYTDNVRYILDRNANKKRILNKLITLPTVLGVIPYKAYFFSCNLDHALHNRNNLSIEEKKQAANNFEDRYANDLPGFVSFINSSVFAVAGNYAESWAFIKLDTNSLKRFSNFHLYPPLTSSPNANTP